MSYSRPTPIQPNPKHAPYPTGAAALNHAMAAASFPRPGPPHGLPPASALAESSARLAPAPPAHLQPSYVPRSPQMKLEHPDFLNHSRPFGSPPRHTLSLLPPPPPRFNYQGAAPLGQLLHPVSYTPSDPSSPASSYAPHGSDRSSNGAGSFRSAPLCSSSSTEYGSYRGMQPTSPNYFQHPEPAGPYQQYPSTTTTTSYTRRAAAPIHVPRTSEPEPKPPDITDRYNLSIRQQPIAARACGFGERDRRVIDPPPILQLTLTDFDPNSSSDVAELRWPFNVVHCALLSSSSTSTSTHTPDADVTTVADPNNANKLSRRLMGTLVASPFVGIDPDAPPASTSTSTSTTSTNPNARLGCFFIFPDLSCRQNGHYRLRFTLMKVNVEMTPTGGQSSIVGAVESSVFEVFSAKDFPGMRASTALTKDLRMQGAAVSVKKGIEAKAGKRGKRRGGGGGATGGKSDSEDSSGSAGGAEAAQSSGSKKKARD